MRPIGKGDFILRNSHQHDHHDSHGDDHAHAVHHHHAGHHHLVPTDFGRAFALAIALNVGFVAIEFFYGFVAHSTALMADAGHNLSDVLGLLLAWGAAVLAKRQPAGRYTYGLRSSSILAALANAMLLLVACGAIAWEAVRRFAEPPEVAGLTVSVVAAVGIAINGASAWLFMAGSKDDLNIRAAFLHMVTDALVSLGVVLAGLLIFATGWSRLDSVISLVIVVIVVAGTWGLLRDALRLSLSAVPEQVDLFEVQQFLAALPGVSEVCDLHIWGMSTTENALTAHLIMPDGYPGDEFMEQISRELAQHHAIHHSTLQVKRSAIQSGCVLHR